MADDVAPQAPGTEPAAPVAVPDDGKSTITASEAARILAQARKRQQPNSQDASAPEATPADESAEQADANPPAEDHGETTDSEAAEPPIAPPVSWTAYAKEQWQTLPRETQDYIARREAERENLLYATQNEAKEQKRTLDNERAKMEQARQQYESAIPALLQSLQQSINSEFPDVRTQDDIDRLAREDWARYILWQRSQEKHAAIANEARAAQERQLSELQGKWQAYAAEQDALFIKAAPEFADKEKAATLQRSAINVLKEIGFTEDELARNWSGQQALSLRDHRLQLLIRDGMRYREAQAAVKKAPVKTVPPVTRPGAAPAPGRALESQIKQLESALDKATGNRSAKIASELYALRRQIASR